MITVLAIVGAVVVVRQIYLHMVAYQKLKAENAFLRRHWKESLASKL